MTDISLIFSMAAMCLGAGGLLLAYRLTKRRPKWIDGIAEEMFKNIWENPETAKKVAKFVKQVLKEMRKKEK
ncbi:hypothetical protein ES705_46959 [subsurface metagenome]